jgi:S-adenosylmethionine:tRNA ribosyltransferase-isomerase
MISNLNLDNYNYSLRNDRIAKYPKSKRDDSKLLVYKEGEFINQKFYNIDKNIPSNSSVFFNNSKVINARLIFKNRNNAKIEILVINLFNENYQNLLFNKKKVVVKTIIKNIKKWKENQTINKSNNDITLKAKQLNNNKVMSLLDLLIV